MRGSLLKTLLFAAAALVTPAPAHAFYWANWPGSGVTEPETITVTQKSFPPITPVYPPPYNPPTETPKGVPEPATLVIAGLGLGVLGLRKVLKRKK